MIRTPLLIFLVCRGLFADEIIRVEADARNGFHWPYFLALPTSLSKPAHILVEPNNAGRSSDDASIHENDARRIAGARISDPSFKEIGSPILVPAFPRPKTNWKLYTHAFDRDTLMAEEVTLRRIDLQLIAMISDAKRRLEARGLRVRAKVFMWGYSAAGTFTSRFVAVHPRMVQAAVYGGCTVPILPIPSHNGKLLRYPIGVGDLEQLTGQKFNSRTFRKVPILIFRGDTDTNDEVAFDDGYDAVDRKLINELFGGPPPIARYPAIEAIYRKAGSKAEFAVETGVGHSDKRTRGALAPFFEKHRR
jgi:hypothetical protein